MLHELLDWPEKINHAYKITKEKLTQNNLEAQKTIPLLFVGMGGSGIAGTIFARILSHKAPHITTDVISSPRIPHNLDPQTRAFICSYSGNTWEVIDVYQELKNQGIQTIIISTGGELGALAKKNNDPFFIVPSCSAPRASLGSFVGIFTALLEHLEIFKLNLESIVKTIENCIETFKNENYFEPITRRLTTHTLTCLGVTNDSDVAAYRAQTQYNENSKIPVIHQNFPEFCHNSIVGITGKKENMLLLLFSTTFLTKHEKQGVKALKAVLDDYQIPWYAVDVHEKEWENQLFELILWADFSSFYGGKARNIDITNVKAIDTLKQYFKKSDNS